MLSIVILNVTKLIAVNVFTLRVSNTKLCIVAFCVSSVIILNAIITNITRLITQCFYAECRHSECHGATITANNRITVNSLLDLKLNLFVVKDVFDVISIFAVLKRFQDFGLNVTKLFAPVIYGCS